MDLADFSKDVKTAGPESSVNFVQGDDGLLM